MNSLRRTITHIRCGLVRKSNAFYYMLVAIGTWILVQFNDIATGAAFIIGGAVGLIMSVITSDVADGIKKVIREDGDLTRAKLGEIKDEISEMKQELSSMGQAIRDLVEELRRDRK